ncbi:MAG: hypothetical protein KC416_15250 [Myxococcales bacterium]|nr:hypothetical protein [Myxococcales bacterium]
MRHEPMAGDGAPFGGGALPRAVGVCLLGAALVACGAKSILDVGDGPATAACNDAGLCVPPGGLALRCPGDLSAPTLGAVSLEGEISTEGDLSGEDRVSGEGQARWELLDAPEGSRAELPGADGLTTELTPDRHGEYRLRLSATSPAGVASSCETRLLATPTPPSVTCPERLDTVPLRDTLLVGEAEDDGEVVRVGWLLDSGPEGSHPDVPLPVEGAEALFRPDIAGTYRLVFFAEDESGDRSECSTELRALATEGLRVEMFWDTGRTDMDLHVLHEDAKGWFGDLDCHYMNCAPGMKLGWGGDARTDDPQLDLDNTKGFGPENINIKRPVPGTYRIGVHAFSGKRFDVGVTVRIYCGGSVVEP